MGCDTNFILKTSKIGRRKIHIQPGYLEICMGKGQNLTHRGFREGYESTYMKVFLRVMTLSLCQTWFAGFPRWAIQIHISSSLWLPKEHICVQRFSCSHMFSIVSNGSGVSRLQPGTLELWFTTKTWFSGVPGWVVWIYLQSIMKSLLFCHSFH